MVKEKSIFKINEFFISKSSLNENYSFKSLIYYFISLIIFIGIINGIKAEINYLDPYSDIFTTISGMPLIYLILFSFFYVFISSFQDNHKKSFWRTYLIIGIPLLTLISTMMVINIIQILLNSTSSNLLLGLLNFILVIYFTIMFILNSKNYFKSNHSKIITSILLTIIINLILVTLLNLFNSGAI